jgi:hypothetical protein
MALTTESLRLRALDISTKNVLGPRLRSSLALTRVKMRSAMPMEGPVEQGWLPRSPAQRDPHVDTEAAHVLPSARPVSAAAPRPSTKRRGTTLAE